ncbi:hypothetical protein WJX82_000219 [Trebouxia sp. C0006]
MSVLTGKSWDLRWCVLTGSSLTYYRSLEDRDWGGAGTVLSLSSLKRFESISSLVFQLYFYQRILQLRAAQEQEAHRWILCLEAAQLQQQKLAADGPNLSQQLAAPSAAASSSPAPSPRHNSTWGGSFSAEEGPHPPLAPSPHAGWAHATTGFRGGVREDPRLRRFREANGAELQLSLPQHASQLVTSSADVHAAASLRNQSTSGHVLAEVCNPQDQIASNGGQLGGGNLGIESGFVDHDVELLGSTQDATKDRGADEKEYWRAPPSLAWGAPAVTTSSSTAANVGWTEYCSDSDESSTSMVSKHAQQVVNVVRRGSSQEWSGSSGCGAF